MRLWSWWKRQWNGLLERLLPPDVKSDPEQVFRARVLLSGVWGMVLCILIASIMRLLLGLPEIVYAPVRFAFLVLLFLPTLFLHKISVSSVGRWVTWLFGCVVLYVAYNGKGIGVAFFAMSPTLILAHLFFTGPRSAFAFAFALGPGLGIVWEFRQFKGLSFVSAQIYQSINSSYTVTLLATSAFALVLGYVLEWSRLRSFAELRSSEERFSFATRVSHDGIFDWELSANTTIVTARFHELLGYNKGTLSLCTPFDECLIMPEHREEVRAVEEALRKGTGEFDIDLRLLDVRGASHWFQMRGEAVYEQGKLSRVIGSIRDISERKRLDQLKDEFVSNVSHELRTPLTSISGSLSLLKGLPTKEPQRLQLLDLASRNADRLLSLVNDLLDFQRLIRGLEELHLEDVRSRSFVGDTLVLHRPLAEKFGVLLMVEECEDFELCIDSDRMHQVFGNLFSNAIKVSEKGDAVKVGCLLVDGQAKLSVSDEGPGIPEHLRDSLFDRFRSDDSPNRHFVPGTGLGLAIAQRLVEAHGGELSFESDEDGTTFTVTLPAL